MGKVAQITYGVIPYLPTLSTPYLTSKVCGGPRGKSKRGMGWDGGGGNARAAAREPRTPPKTVHHTHPPSLPLPPFQTHSKEKRERGKQTAAWARVPIIGGGWWWWWCFLVTPQMHPRTHHSCKHGGRNKSVHRLRHSHTHKQIESRFRSLDSSHQTASGWNAGKKCGGEDLFGFLLLESVEGLSSKSLSKNNCKENKLSSSQPRRRRSS